MTSGIEEILLASSILIAPVGICITLVSLRSYLKFRNWRLLFLSAAFLLLSIPPTINVFLATYGSFSFDISPWSYSILRYVSFIFSLSSVLPFALLAYVYINERKTQSIRISRNLWIVGGIIFLGQLGLIVYEVVSSYNLPYGNSSWYQPYLIDYIFGGVASLLIIMIVISLFAYYRAKRTKNTLLVIIGFIFLFVGYGYGVPLFSIFQGTYLNYNYYGLQYFFELIGFIAFLVALIRLKVS